MVQKSDQESIYDRFSTVTKQTKDLLESINALSDQVSQLLAENVKLSMENEHLRSQLTGKKKDNDEGLSDSRKILKKLYQEGFHVCNDMYGKRLGKNESCTFCLETIYGRHEPKEKGHSHANSL